MCKILNSPFNSGATKRVLAADAAGFEADYICNGIDDHLQIQDALNTLPENGGTVVLSEGNFNLSAPIIMPEKSVRLLGQGMPFNHPNDLTSKLIFTLPEPENCIVFDDWHHSQAIENINIFGDGINTEIGIQVLSAFKVVRDVSIYNVTKYGMRCEGESSQGIFENVYMRNLDCPGLQSWGVAMLFNNINVNRGSAVGVSDVHIGIDIHDSGSTYLACISEGYNWGCVLGTFAKGNTVIGPHTERCNIGIFVGGGKDIEALGNSIMGGSVIGDQSPDKASVVISRAFGTTISGLSIGPNISEIGFHITSHAIDTLIMGGWIETPTKIKDEGVGTQVI